MQAWQKLINELTEEIHPQSRRVDIKEGDRTDIYYKGAGTISKYIIQAVNQQRKSQVVKGS